MIELRKTPEFDRWFAGLRDQQALGRIQRRIDRLEEGYLGDHKYVGNGVFELRIHSGPGYRVYGTHRGSEWVLLLAGGDKGSQERDIRLALKLARKGE